MATAACGSSGSVTQASTPATKVLRISGPASLYAGTTGKLFATLSASPATNYDEPGDVSSGAVWSSSDSAVLTVADNGLIRAVAPGTASISATFQGTVSDPFAVSVTAFPNGTAGRRR